MSRLHKYLLAAAMAATLSLLTASLGVAATAIPETVQGVETGAGGIGYFITPAGLQPCSGSCFSGSAQGPLQGVWSAEVFVQFVGGLPSKVTGGSFYLGSPAPGTVDPSNSITPGSPIPLGWGLCKQAFTITTNPSLGVTGHVALTNVTLTHFGYLSAGGCHAVAATIRGSVTLYQ